jgi:hypothetical protein
LILRHSEVFRGHEKERRLTISVSRPVTPFVKRSADSDIVLNEILSAILGLWSQQAGRLAAQCS